MHNWLVESGVWRLRLLPLSMWWWARKSSAGLNRRTFSHLCDGEVWLCSLCLWLLLGNSHKATFIGQQSKLAVSTAAAGASSGPTGGRYLKRQHVTSKPSPWMHHDDFLPRWWTHCLLLKKQTPTSSSLELASEPPVYSHCCRQDPKAAAFLNPSHQSSHSGPALWGGRACASELTPANHSCDLTTCSPPIWEPNEWRRLKNTAWYFWSWWRRRLSETNSTE